MGGNSQMGGPSTVQPNGNPLASLFAGSQGYQQPQQPQQMAPPPPAIQQPGYGMPALTPQQAALATQQRMQLRTPPVATPAAPQRQNGSWIATGAHGGGGERWISDVSAPNQNLSPPPPFKL